MAAAVLASHHYSTFNGTPFMTWLSLVMAELNPDNEWDPKVISWKDSPDFRDRSEIWSNVLSEMVIPVLAPINMEWSVDSLVTGRLKWCANKSERDGEISTHSDCNVIIECKDTEVSGSILKTVAEKKSADKCAVGVLFARETTNFEEETLQKINDNVDVCKMDTVDRLRMLTNQPKASKLLIVVDLEEIYKNRKLKVAHLN